MLAVLVACIGIGSSLKGAQCPLSCWDVAGVHKECKSKPWHNDISAFRYLDRHPMLSNAIPIIVVVLGHSFILGSISLLSSHNWQEMFILSNTTTTTSTSSISALRIPPALKYHPPSDTSFLSKEP